LRQYSILIIENDLYLRQTIINSLSKDNFILHEAASGRDGYTILGNTVVDLIILDLHLGDMDGSIILKSLRDQFIRTPVIIISTADSIQSKIENFTIGCDDYLTKPFYFEELIIRVKKLLKTNENLINNKNNTLDEIIEVGEFKFDFLRYKVDKNGKNIELNSKLFNLFFYLVKNKNTLLTREQIYQNIWSNENHINDNTLSVHIHMLRNLIEDDPKNPRYIKTIKSEGIIFSCNE